ncbi:hypothetical protein [Actinoplanes sp. NPDC049599]|uniref:hypothetical protein n=1 Tax=Actinoplanes sp. NPDC049599 TaxID=3363903 RepID=UPI0037B5319B
MPRHAAGDAVARPGNGPDTVLSWIRLLHRGTADGAVWGALTPELRLAVSQLYLVSVRSGNDDARAARLAAVEPADADFPAMLHRQCQAWRKTYLPLARGADPAAAVVVGSDMEMVTLTARPVRPGHGAGPPAVYRFLVRHWWGDVTIAALGSRLTVPGWPPVQWSIPHLPHN